MTRSKLTVDLGPLLAPLRTYCDRKGLRPSDVVRRSLARTLGQEVPEMRGQLVNLKQYQSQRRKQPKKRSHAT